MTNIRVALRVRPMSHRETGDNYPVAVAVDGNTAFITDIRVPERPSADSRQRFRQFQFDHTFWFTNTRVGRAASQLQVYQEMGPHLEKAILAGYNACLLAYGQSGTGKTHTMLGSKEDPGIIPRLCHSLWDKLKVTHSTPLRNGEPSFRLEVSFMEIYREKARDLLDPNKSLKLREHPQLGPHVQGLTKLEVTGEISLLDLLWEGERRRASGQTSSNPRSSRSHAIWTLYLTVHDESKCSESGPGESRAQRIIRNQAHLVDLAGSEKADCSTAKSLLAEGADINRSLVALGNVISALAERANYVPYRDSALTWLLKDSIGGNASTSIIITASPSSLCHAQTLNSLRFAQRARLVENTPKINLAPVSPFHCGPYGHLSVMSAMELKKDISRLAKIIKTAQDNGGILRGLAPRTGWTRLIHAIEGISQAEKEQVRLQRERACSEDTSASSSSRAGTSSTITAAKSLNDVMVQADMEKRNPLFRRRPSRQSDSTIAVSTLAESPTKIVGTEVFIPTSNSIKCLTWQQEETRPVPKPISSSTSSLSESQEDDGSSTPLTKCSSTPQIHHMKYLLQIHTPTTHNLEHAARISERIHGSITDDNYSNKTELIPVEVPHPLHPKGPLILDKIPTIVNPSDLASPEAMNERAFPAEDKELRRRAVASQSVMVGCIARESKDYLFPTKCREFASKLSLRLSPFEDVGDTEFDEPEEILGSGQVFRVVDPQTSMGLGHTMLSGTFEDTCYFTAGDSVLSQIPMMISSSCESSSSYESLHIPETVRPVNLVREFSTTDSFEDHLTQELVIDEDEVFKDDFEAPMANVCMVAGHPMEMALPVEILVAEPPSSTDNYFNPVNGVSDSKFRNYFAKELHIMDKMGKQIKNLLQMTQRYNVVKPYLDEISNLQNSDHSKPDPKLDAHIDSCSGWNVDIELAKVNEEIHSLNKVLKTGIGSGNNIGVKGGGDYFRAESLKSTSSTYEGGVTSDSSMETVGGHHFASYAHTRHIPLLSGQRSYKPMSVSIPARASVSQPAFSSSSNNASNASTSIVMSNTSFTPTFFSTPKAKLHKPWTQNERSCINEDHDIFEPSSYHQVPFKSRAEPSVTSAHTFYRNPGMGGSRLNYCPSNSNMSSVSSNTSARVNYDSTTQTSTSHLRESSETRYPLNISHSEPRPLPSGLHGGNKSYLRSSESSTSFLLPPPKQTVRNHSFDSEEIQSHRRMYDNGGARYGSLTRGEGRNVGGHGGGDNNLNTNCGIGASGDSQGGRYYDYLDNHHDLGHVSSANDLLQMSFLSKYGSDTASSQRKSSKPHLNNLVTSATPEASEYASDPVYSSSSTSCHHGWRPTGSGMSRNSTPGSEFNVSSRSASKMRTSQQNVTSRNHSLYSTPRINRNERF